MSGLGYVLDPAPTLTERLGSKARTARARLGALPAYGGIEVEPLIRDQGFHEACTGFFAAQAIWALAGEEVSPYFPWWFGRAHDLNLIDNLPDLGVTMSSMRRALRLHGACPYDHWNPRTPGFSIEDRPPAFARVRAQKRNLYTTPIVERGSAAVDAVCAALNKGLPVGIVVDVDEAFEHPDSNGIVGPRKGASRGLHIVTGWDFSAGAGSKLVGFVNSWGYSYGKSGRGWLNPSRIENAPYLCVAHEVK